MSSLSQSLSLCQPRRRRENLRLLSQTHSVAIPSGMSNSVKNCSLARCSGVGVVRAATEVVVDDPVVREGGKEKGRVLRVGVICGGPSAERGISLNSARSVIDHIQGDDLLVSCYYIDCNLNAYAISPAQVYSNTPTDFDFKLESLAQGFRSLSDFAEHLAASVDIVFPVIHGRFGEDGGIQELLEKSNIPFVGTRSNECRQAFDKYDSSLELDRQGFVTVPNFLVQGSHSNESELSKWFAENHLDTNSGKVVVKPTRAGSSIGVTVAYGVADSLKKANEIVAEGIDDRVLVEIFLEGGSEFTAIVLDVGSGFDCHPVVLLPTEVEIQLHDNADMREKDAIFNYRRKYLPTQQVAYHTPPRFPMDVIGSIREGASLLFQRLGLHDFARIDGWFLPSSIHIPSASEKKLGRTKSGTVIFTDINLISGMEQTSFLFQQASKVGFSHSNILRSIIQRACLRFPNLASYTSLSSLLLRRSKSSQLIEAFPKTKDVRKVFVIFGGDTSERQVSLMSGTNVWLNLQAFNDVGIK
ncbi:D-alanine--D-alanine ligase isoform X2 [Vitis riparia]|uniref:D-alanine--D-alanine ligase isoform X2 n=1 Tax=Vitis riparia TaxID=96939 RepID=UPI00155AEF9F|nr:D-alanine--D-alanine ligase isoform X2 [Vitis riparia]